MPGQVVAPTFPGSGGLLANGPVTLEQLSPEQQQALLAQMQAAQAEQPAGGAGSGSSADDVVDAEIVDDEANEAK